MILYKLTLDYKFLCNYFQHCDEVMPYDHPANFYISL